MEGWGEDRLQKERVPKGKEIANKFYLRPLGGNVWSEVKGQDCGDKEHQCGLAATYWPIHRSKLGGGETGRCVNVYH